MSVKHGYGLRIRITDYGLRIRITDTDYGYGYGKRSTEYEFGIRKTELRISAMSCCFFLACCIHVYDGETLEANALLRWVPFARRSKSNRTSLITVWTKSDHVNSGRRKVRSRAYKLVLLKADVHEDRCIEDGCCLQTMNVDTQL